MESKAAISLRKATMEAHTVEDDTTADRAVDDTTGGSDRDEVKEIELRSKKQTKRIRLWRLLVTVGLAATGIAVSASTYLLLLNQEEENFTNAVSSEPSRCAFCYVNPCLHAR